jgi:hypothetical protein
MGSCREAIFFAALVFMYVYEKYEKKPPVVAIITGKKCSMQ